MRDKKVAQGITLMVIAFALKFIASAWDFTIKVTKQGPWYEDKMYLKELHILCTRGG